jgi:hypothetical protein
MKGMTAQDAADGQNQAAQASVFPDRIHGIAGAGRTKPATGTEDQAQAELVSPDQRYPHLSHDPVSSPGFVPASPIL